MILVLHAVNRSGLVMDGTRYIGAAERAEAWLSRPWRRSVQGHRLFESGRVGATVAELRSDVRMRNSLHFHTRPRRSSVTVAPEIDKGDGPAKRVGGISDVQSNCYSAARHNSARPLPSGRFDGEGPLGHREP